MSQIRWFKMIRSELTIWTTLFDNTDITLPFCTWLVLSPLSTTYQSHSNGMLHTHKLASLSWVTKAGFLRWGKCFIMTQTILSWLIIWLLPPPPVFLFHCHQVQHSGWDLLLQLWQACLWAVTGTSCSNSQQVCHSIEQWEVGSCFSFKSSCLHWQGILYFTGCPLAPRSLMTHILHSHQPKLQENSFIKIALLQFYKIYWKI